MQFLFCVYLTFLIIKFTGEPICVILVLLKHTVRMVNLKINVLKPHNVTSNNVYHHKDEDTIIHEQILRVPDSEKLKVLISTDTEIDKIEVFVKNKKDDADAFNSYVDAVTTQSSPNSFTNLTKPNEVRTPQNIFEEDDDKLQDVESLTDDDLRWWLICCNAQVGPIVDSTRKMYQSKLASLLQERKALKLVSQISGKFPKMNESPNIEHLTGREIHTISKRKNISCGSGREIQKHERMQDQNTRVIHTFSKLKRSQHGDNRNIPNHELEVMKKDGMIMKTFLSLLRAFVTLIKLILFAVSGMVTYYLVFESE